MRKWQSLGALVFLGSVVACATATNGGALVGGTGGTDSSGATGGDLVGSAGGDGALTAGTGSTFGGTASVGGQTSLGGQTAFGGTASMTAGSFSGGDSGALTGGSSGTSSGGTSSAGSGGASAGGATNTGPCANPKDVSKGTSNSLGTLGPVCMRTMETFNTLACYNFDGRTMTVNGVLFACSSNSTSKGTFAPTIDGYTYFDVSAGTKDYASFNWYTQ